MLKLKSDSCKNSKGISLMALVITIIVLLILAGVSIYTIAGNNGVLRKSTKAKELEKNAEAVEKINDIFRTSALDAGATSGQEYIAEIMSENSDKFLDVRKIDDDNDEDGENEVLAVQWKEDQKWYKVENVDGLYKVTDIIPEVSAEAPRVNNVKISFNAEGGTEISPKFLVPGYTFDSLPNPVKVGYKFEGWYTVPDGDESESEKITATSIVPNEDTTYYAHWIVNVQDTGELALILDETEYYYDGIEHKPTVIVTYHGELVEPKNYDVNYYDDNSDNDENKNEDLINAGGKHVIVELKGYYGGTISENYVIKKSDAVNPTITPKNLTYNGAAQELITSSGGSGGTIEYSINNSIWNTIIPKETNAGTYTVYAKVIPDSNHVEVPAVNVSVTIAKKTENPTVTAKSLTYTGSGQELVTTTGAQGTMHYKLDNGSWGTTIPSATNAGSYTVSYYMDESANYTEVGSSSSPKTVNVTIAKKTENPTVTAKSLTYTGSGQALVTTTGAQGTMHYKLDNGSWGTTIPSATNAGSYTVSYYMDESANYTAVGSSSSPKTVSVTIAKKTENPAVTAKSLTFTGSAQALVTVSGAQGSMHYKLGNGSWGTTIPSATNAGSYTVYWYMDGTSNYNAVGTSSAPKSVAITIAKKTTNPTVSGRTVTYNAAAQALVAVSGNQGTMHYKLGNGSWGTAIPTATAPGSYTVYWYMDASTNYNAVGTSSSPKSASAKINDLTYTVTFNGNGGSGTSRSVRYKATVGTLPSSSRTGYTFAGWYTAASGGTQVSASYQVTKAVTFYAHWTPITYQIGLVPLWAAGFGSIVTSYGVDSTNQAHITGTSKSFSNVSLVKGHHYTLRGGPFCVTSIPEFSVTISAGSTISYTGTAKHIGANPGGEFCRLFKNLGSNQTVTPTITTTRYVNYNQFAVSELALYDITSTPHLVIDKSTADRMVIEYTVETASFTVPNMIQPNGSGGTKTCYWLKNNVKVQNVQVPKGSTGSFDLGHGGS